jgi:hypothetical protein
VLNLFVDVDRVMAFDEAGLAVDGPQSRQSLQG